VYICHEIELRTIYLNYKIMKKFTLALAALLVSAMTVGAAAQTTATTTTKEVKECCKKAAKKCVKADSLKLKAKACGKCAAAQASGKCCKAKEGACCKADSLKAKAKASCCKKASK
jgi:hypothetical protein